MSPVWWTIVALTLTTIAIRAAGPVALGGRPLPPVFASVIALLAAAVLAAFVVTQGFAEGSRLTVDPRAAGLAAAGLALLARAGVVVTMLSAAAVTAGVRALT